MTVTLGRGFSMQSRASTRPARRATLISAATAAVALVLGATTRDAQAAYTFDANTSSANAQDGGGTWDATTANWWNDAATPPANAPWPGSTTATFGAGVDGAENAYVINVGTSFTNVNGLTFLNSGYKLSAASTVSLRRTGAFIAVSVAPGKTATIGDNVTVTEFTNSGALPISGGGTLNLEGGGVTTSNGFESIRITGGTTVNVKTNGRLQTLKAEVSTNSPIQLQSGTINATGGQISSRGANIEVGGVNDATATLTIQSGGSVTTGATSGTNPSARSLSYQLGGTNRTAVVNLNGGTLTTNGITVAAPGTGSTGTFNFNGGTLKSMTANASFMSGLTAANVKAGGAILDTAVGITIAQPLLHDASLSTADGGLTKNGAGTLTLSGANTYTGDTVVSAGALDLTGGSLLLDINSSGGFSDIRGTGAVTLNNRLRLDTSDVTGEGAWTLIGASLTETYGASFAIALAGSSADTLFTSDGAGMWTLNDGGRTWTYAQSSGVLTLAVPEPASIGVLAAFAGTLALRRSRRIAS